MTIDAIFLGFEMLTTISLCVAYYLMFGRVRSSHRVKVAEHIALYSTLLVFALARNVRVWVLFLLFFLIGTLKKQAAKNERRNKGYNH